MGLPLHTACAAFAPTPVPNPRPYRVPNSCAPFSTRQEASAFNQPLSIDTSSVTDMNSMFRVRPERVKRSMPSRGFPGTLLASPSPHAPLPSPCPHRAPPHIAPLSTLQFTSAFNQPLSFDMSSVTTMFGMFYVSTRGPCARA